MFAMQESDREQAEIAALATEFCKDYDEHIQKTESAFRVAAMQLFINSEKEERLKKSPLLKLYQNISERITDRMVELGEGISEERQNQIITDVRFYYRYRNHCLVCNRRKFQKKYKDYFAHKKAKLTQV